MRFSTFPILMAGLAAPVAGHAEEINGFDPNMSCVQVLANTGGTTDQFMIAAWVIGYLGAANGKVLPVTISNNKVILENLTQACIQSGQASLLELVQRSAPSKAEPARPGSEAEARLLLEQFLDPATDRYALTRALLPQPQEIREVYDEPLASLMLQTYEEALKPGVAIEPNPGQSELLVVYTTTGALRQGDPVLGEFPGGYGKVVGFMKGNHPIVRFKFVKPGETLGMAYDGLVHVGGRWVWMPKPWRALP